MAANRTTEKRVLNQYVYYTSTSNAYKLNEVERIEPKAVVHEESAVRPQPKLKKGVVVKVAIVAAIILVGAALLVARYERMSAMSIKINSLKTQINDIENDIDSLNVKLQYAMDINTAQQIAKDELGMDYPDSTQVLSVETSSYTAHSATPVYAAVPVQSYAEGGE